MALAGGYAMKLGGGYAMALGGGGRTERTLLMVVAGEPACTLASLGAGCPLATL